MLALCDIIGCYQNWKTNIKASEKSSADAVRNEKRIVEALLFLCFQSDVQSYFNEAF